MNNRPDVANETRQRVLEVIERLDYHPSAVARSLVQQRSNILGVVTSGLEFTGPSRTLYGIAHQAENLDYAILLKEFRQDQSVRIDELLRVLLSRQVDGIIWAVPEIGNAWGLLKEHFSDLPVPIMFLSMESHPHISTVTIDNYQGGCLATQHLLDHGYQKIGHITGPLGWWEAQERKRGWQETLKNHGITILEDHWVEGTWFSEDGERTFRKLLRQFPDMEAVFVANDQMALSLLYTACETNIQIPQDLAIVGFDGIDEAAYFWPPLTTVVQDQYRLGCVSVQELVNIIEHQRRGVEVATQHISLQPHLVVRRSSTLQAPISNQSK